MFEETTFEKLHGKDEVWSVTGKIAENKDVGLFVLRGVTCVWHNKFQNNDQECNINRIYDGIAKFSKFEPETNLTGRIQDTALQADFILPIEEVKSCNGRKLWPVANELYLLIFYEQTLRSLRPSKMPRENNLTKLHDLSTHFQFYKDINVDRFQRRAGDLQ